MEEPVRRSFIFYKSFVDMLSLMDDEQFRNSMMTLYNYVYFDIEPEIEELSTEEKMFFYAVKPIVDADIEKFENRNKYKNY